MFAILGEGSLAVVEFLINSGADPGKGNNRGTTPLHCAASRGYCEIAQYLLSRGAYVDPLCQDEEAPLHFAARRGHAGLVKLLLDHNADCNRLSYYRHTPLVLSLFASSLECLEKFIEVRADINTGSPVTPLSVAARQGLADCINRLLVYNADPNEPNEDGKLPIEIAASRGWVECVEILLPVTNPLEKYANLSIVQMVRQETTARQIEELRVIADGDVAYWEKRYAEALQCYTKALRLGHGDLALYAKKALCHLYTHDPHRYLDEAYYYADHVLPGSLSPCSEEEAKRLVLEYGMKWKASNSDSGNNPTDEASREEHP